MGQEQDFWVKVFYGSFLRNGNIVCERERGVAPVTQEETNLTFLGKLRLVRLPLPQKQVNNCSGSGLPIRLQRGDSQNQGSACKLHQSSRAAAFENLHSCFPGLLSDASAFESSLPAPVSSSNKNSLVRQVELWHSCMS